MQNILETLTIVASIQGVILGLVIVLSKHFNSTGKLYLGLLIISISLLVGRETLSEDLVKLIYIPYINTWGLSILLGPLIYFYVSVVTSMRIVKYILWHFVVPFLYYCLLNYALYKGIASEEAVVQYPVILAIYTGFQVFIVIQLPVYLFLSLKLIVQFHRRLKDEYADLEKVNLKWLQFLLSSFAVIYLLWIVFFSGDILIVKEVRVVPDKLMSLLLASLIYAVGYFTLLRPEIFQTTLQRRKGKALTEQPDAEEVAELKFRLNEAIEKKKVYLNKRLTVKNLAAEIGSTPKRTSQIINSEFNQSFYDLINALRIEEAKQNLIDKKFAHLTIEGIALNSGFNSSSTFNRLFKSYTGQTPKDFRSV